jgi:hypothetical protein
MGRPCRVCNHECAADIGRDLLHRVSYRAIAKQYGVAIAGFSAECRHAFPNDANFN